MLIFLRPRRDAERALRGVFCAARQSSAVCARIQMCMYLSIYLSIYLSLYIYIYIYVFVNIYIYIYTEREREREIFYGR